MIYNSLQQELKVIINELKERMHKQSQLILNQNLNDVQFEEALTKLKEDFLEPMQTMIDFGKKMKEEHVMFKRKRMEILNSMQYELHSIALIKLNELKKSQ